MPSSPREIAKTTNPEPIGTSEAGHRTVEIPDAVLEVPGEEVSYGSTVTGESNSQPATPQELANLMFLSYRFSQGSNDTQRQMLLYIEDKFHPYFSKDPQYEEVMALTSKMVEAYYMKDALHPATPPANQEGEYVKSKEQVDSSLRGLFGIFEDRKDYQYGPVDIARSIINDDLRYLKQPGGRADSDGPNKGEIDKYGGDPYASYFVEYGILGKSTRSDEYNELFADASSEETIKQLGSDHLKHLQDALRIYVDKHPDMKEDERMLKAQALCLKELVPPPKGYGYAAAKSVWSQDLTGLFAEKRIYPRGLADMLAIEPGILRTEGPAEDILTEYWDRHGVEVATSIAIQTDDYELAGFGSILRKGNSGELSNFIVHSAHRGKGVAEVLILESLRLAENKGIDSFYIPSFGVSDDLRAFYKEHGFEETPEGGLAKGLNPLSITGYPPEA